MGKSLGSSPSKVICSDVFLGTLIVKSFPKGQAVAISAFNSTHLI